MLVSGTTESRLEELLPLGAEPEAGGNGVLSVSEGLVRYRIGHILYEDRGVDTFFFYYPPRNREGQEPLVALPLINDHQKYSDVNVSFDRGDFSVFRPIYNLEYLEDSDVEAFPVNFF